MVSDVIGDDLASIGSGPCVPDPTTAGEIRGQLEQTGSGLDYLNRVGPGALGLKPEIERRLRNRATMHLPRVSLE